MAELVKYVQESNDRGRIEVAIALLWNSKNPAVIPHAAALLDYPEEAEVVGKGGELSALISQSMAKETNAKWAARMISEIIGERPEISLEVQEWLGMMPQHIGPEATVRRLWEENKEAFAHQDYKAVKAPQLLATDATNVAVSAAETNWTTLVEKSLRYPNVIDFRSLSIEDRAKVVSEFRRFVSDRQFKHRAVSQLVRLGDEQTMAEVVKSVLNGEGVEATFMLHSVLTNLALIPHLAELLYYPENVLIVVRGPRIGLVHCPRPVLGSIMIRDLIGGSVKFSPELRSWLVSAPRSLLEDSSSWFIHELRQRVQGCPESVALDCISYWYIRPLWEENKEAFLRHDYAAVKPPKTVRLPEKPAATNQTPSTIIIPPAKP